MSYWLALVLRERREAGGIRLSEVAGLSKVDQSTINRVEKGLTLAPDIDHYVAAYAKLLDLDDGRELWNQALDRWMREGAPPVLIGQLEGESAIEQRERDLRETKIRRARKQEPRLSDEKTRSTRKKRAGG